MCARLRVSLTTLKRGNEKACGQVTQLVDRLTSDGNISTMTLRPALRVVPRLMHAWSLDTPGLPRGSCIADISIAGTTLRFTQSGTRHTGRVGGRSHLIMGNL